MSNRLGTQISTGPPCTCWGSSEGCPYHRPIPGQKFPYQPVSFGGVSMDWKETEEAHVFKANVPGLKKEDVKVEIWKGSILRITGERKRGDVDQKNDTWHLVERGSGKFDRKLRLPENVNVDEVKADVLAGVLTVTVPKLDHLNNVRSIPVSGCSKLCCSKLN